MKKIILSLIFLSISTHADTIDDIYRMPIFKNDVDFPFPDITYYQVNNVKNFIAQYSSDDLDKLINICDTNRNFSQQANIDSDIRIIKMQICYKFKTIKKFYDDNNDKESSNQNNAPQK